MEQPEVVLDLRLSRRVSGGPDAALLRAVESFTENLPLGIQSGKPPFPPIVIPLLKDGAGRVMDLRAAEAIRENLRRCFLKITNPTYPRLESVNEVLLSRAQAAFYLGCSPRTVDAYCKQGLLVKQGGKITTDSIRRLKKTPLQASRPASPRPQVIR